MTGTTSGIGQAAARVLAAEGCREVIVTGRSPAPVKAELFGWAVPVVVWFALRYYAGATYGVATLSARGLLIA